MKILSIDTTSMRGSIALSDGATLVALDRQEEPSSHSERLFGKLDSMLAESGWGISDIEGVAVAIGPGSFTGLRTGLAAAKGVALSLEVPIAGVSSLKSLALNGDDYSLKYVATLIDARRGELYAALWDISARGFPAEIISESLLSPEALIEKLRQFGSHFLAVGDGAIAYRDRLSAELGDSIQIADGMGILPNAHNLALLAGERLSSGGDDLKKLVPNYIRQSDAEIGFLGKGK
ncbi:MAG TPA: tRNA (adenosine(37)-N6)-threonylcarbamoyltransferase complex dimerization subunit type 1 TsaB [bacterium]|nr:MAG: tRNA threonylcarbamoyladenosine biosynthesis protein TsaB [bacterium ADurb.Bin270]HPW45957.1 tRNA (adenosine(37)-N6)-threonylcarbamoyltransferase complex dimerization subunit type 1 TsaB [bacterium]